MFCIVTYHMLGCILGSLQRIWTGEDEEESVRGVEVMIIIVAMEVPIYRIAEADPQGRDVTVIVIVTVRTPTVACAVPMGVDMYVIILVIVLKDEAVIQKAAVAIQESKATMTTPSKQDRVGDSFDDNSFHIISISPFFP